MKPNQVTPEIIENYKNRNLISYAEMAEKMGYGRINFYNNLHHLRQGMSAIKFRKKVAEFFNDRNITLEELKWNAEEHLQQN